MNDDLKEYVESLTPEQTRKLYQEIRATERDVLLDPNIQTPNGKALLLYEIRELEILLERAQGLPIHSEASTMNFMNFINKMVVCP